MSRVVKSSAVNDAVLRAFYNSSFFLEGGLIMVYLGSDAGSTLLNFHIRHVYA